MWWSNVFLGVSHAPHRKGGGSHPKNFGTYMHAHSTRNSNQTLHGDQTFEENFYTVDHECWRAICLGQLTFFLNFLLAWQVDNSSVPELNDALERRICIVINYNRLFMTLFRTKSTDVVKDCQYFFGTVLPSVLVLRKVDKLALRYRCLENAFCTYCRSI